ncbi:MAG: hypothetical protein P0Y66_22370 [Candidatus Kaistia colombiensis]|nr:MAG: hypothetical protein P0Y66_22370 [Kaistia sp.]
MNTLYLLICENDETPRLSAGRSVEGSEQDGMTTPERVAEVIMRGLYNGERIIGCSKMDLDTFTSVPATIEVAVALQTRLGPYLRDEREEHEAAIDFVERALGLVLDGDRWIPEFVAGDWTVPYGAECQRVAA